MNKELDQALSELSDIQRDAARWGDGPLLVLAGPGSGKTQVLTVRAAHLLDQSQDENFRILALTFTTKAGDEMARRIQALVPGLEDRVFAGTFHSFCADILRQHGVHIGIKPDFSIYSQDTDRQALLADALNAANKRGEDVTPADVRFLSLIDRLKSRLVSPMQAATLVSPPDTARKVTRIFELYEAALREANVFDFNSLIQEAYHLLAKYPAIATRYQKTYRYWMLDEFQDTNTGQYKFITTLAGPSFKNLFVVADDDQIIYQWNGASYRQLEHYRKDFHPTLVQLPTNFRCPPAIVGAANNLVINNTQRTPDKQPLIAGKTTTRLPESEHLRLWHFADEDAEAQFIAKDIVGRTVADRGKVGVLARTRTLLERVHRALVEAGVSAVIAQRRDQFVSPQFVWLDACLRQAMRPLDRRNFDVLVASFNRFASLELATDLVVSEAEASSRSFLDVWAEHAQRVASSNQQIFASGVRDLCANLSSYRAFIDACLDAFKGMSTADSNAFDLQEDLNVWGDLQRELNQAIGRDAPLHSFVQELGMRSKEPTLKPGNVALMTIHGAKGKQFEYVYAVGMAEELLPSFQSIRQGDKSAELEEERRNCFVAITRTQESLTLSWADKYRGYDKKPSRFLSEMGLQPSSVPTQKA